MKIDYTLVSIKQVRKCNFIKYNIYNSRKKYAVPRKNAVTVFLNDFSIENYEMSSEDIEEYLNKWKKISHAWTGKRNIKLFHMAPN